MFPSGSHRANTTTPPASTLRVQSSILGTPRPIGWGQNRLAANLLWYGNFVAVPHTTQSGGSAGKGAVTGGGGGKGGGGTTTTYTYNTGVLMGLCEGPVTSILNVWNNKTLQSLASLNLTAILGTYAQSPWAYLTTNSPANARNYRGTTAVGGGPLDLGQQQQLPNLSFEVKFAIADGISGLPDADPKDILTDALTNAFYGMGFPASRLGDLSIWSSYCRATGMVMSPLLTSSSAGSSFIADLMRATNSEAVWSGGKLTVVPYGDQTISANGATYTAPSAPLYAVGETDLLPNSGGVSPEPVDIKRSSQSDAYNVVKVQFTDRSNAYNPDVVMAQDEASVLEYGIRLNDVNAASLFCDRAAAQMSAQLILGRQSVRNWPVITLGPEYILLDPMDIIAYADTILGASSQWIRIREIQENDDGSLTLTVEEYQAGTAAAPIYGTQANAGYVPNYNVSPGSANTPAVFDVPVELAEVVGLETWLATSGGVNWGGCEVHISSDGTTYAFAGTINGPSRMGTLTSTLPVGSATDTVNTLAVDLTTSRAALTGGTANDLARSTTLCFVDGEYVAYQQASLTSAYHYNLGKNGGTPGTITRGLYGSAIASHPSGSVFVRLDDSVFINRYTKADVGRTIYIKLVSFNIWQGGLEDISSVAVYTHVVGGPPTLYAPFATGAVAGIKSIDVSWHNPPDVGVECTEIWRSSSSSFGGATKLGEAASYANSWVDLNLVSATQYWYWIRIRDIAGNFSAYDPSSAGAGATATTLQAVANDIATGAVTGPKIASGAIDTLKFAAGIVPVELFSSAPVTGNFEGRQYYNTTIGLLYKYHSGAWTAFIDGADILAYTVLPSKVYIGGSDNLCLDGACNDVNYWQAYGAPGSGLGILTGIGGTWVNDHVFTAQSAPVGNGSGWEHKPVACQPGDNFALSLRMGTSSSTADLRLYAHWRDSTGADIISTLIDFTGSGATGGPWGLAGTAVAPAGAAYVSLLAYSIPTVSSGIGINFTTPVLRRRMTAQLIVDGEIIAGKLAVGAVNATAIVVDNILVTGKLVANSITNAQAGVGGGGAVGLNSWTTVASITFTAYGGQVLINFTDWWSWSSSGPRGYARIVRDPGTVQIMYTKVGGGSCPDAIILAGAGLDTPASGSTTYYLQEYYEAGNQPTSQQPVLVVTELKR